MEYSEETEKKEKEVKQEVVLHYYHFLEESNGPEDGKYVIVRRSDGEELFATLPRRRAELHADIIDILESELSEKVTCIGGGYFEKVDPSKETDNVWAVQGKSSDFGVEENRKRTAMLVQAQFQNLLIRW